MGIEIFEKGEQVLQLRVKVHQGTHEQSRDNKYFRGKKAVKEKNKGTVR